MPKTEKIQNNGCGKSLEDDSKTQTKTTDVADVTNTSLLTQPKQSDLDNTDKETKTTNTSLLTKTKPPYKDYLLKRDTFSHSVDTSSFFNAATYFLTNTKNPIMNNDIFMFSEDEKKQYLKRISAFVNEKLKQENFNKETKKRKYQHLEQESKDEKSNCTQTSNIILPTCDNQPFIGQKSQKFIFPTIEDYKHELKSSISANDLKNTLIVLGPELSTGYFNSIEFDMLTKQTEQIRKTHHTFDFTPSLYVFANDSLLKQDKDEITSKDVAYVVAAFKSSLKGSSILDNINNTYMFTSLCKNLPDKKIIVVTSPVLNSNGDLRNIGMGYNVVVVFVSTIKKCNQCQNNCCYHVVALKRNNIININNSNNRQKYKVKECESQAEYAENMLDLTTKNIIEQVICTKQSVNSFDKYYK